MIVENKDGEKYKIKQSPEETYNEFVDCCYGEEYGPGLQGSDACFGQLTVFSFPYKT